MQELSLKIIEEAIYEMCLKANIYLPKEVYNKIDEASKTDNNNKYILKNAQIAAQRQRPLCQDTGQVIVFANIGQDIHFCDGSFEKTVNDAVAKCYVKNYFRKSVVKNALLNRENTQNNTPCVLHTKIVDGDEVQISIMIKGGGSENVTGLKMLNPTATKEQMYEEVLKILNNAGKNACLPIFVGAGVGQTAEDALLLSKKSIICGEEDKNLCDFLNKNFKTDLIRPVLSTKVLTASSHIASMPLGVTILCHSNRYNSCKIKNNKIEYTTSFQIPKDIELSIDGDEIKVDDIDALKEIKKGDKFYLSGTVFVARDQAHKKLVEMLDKGENLPINLENAFIFYAGPCPNKENEISGPIGPTTSKRMDNFAVKLYDNGVFATLGKGQRSAELEDYALKNGKKYFEVQGGIASYLANCVKSSQIVAFDELGPEALRKIEVCKLPVTCVF